jgi:hypothetical protein
MQLVHAKPPYQKIVTKVVLSCLVMGPYGTFCIPVAPLYIGISIICLSVLKKLAIPILTYSFPGVAIPFPVASFCFRISEFDESRKSAKHGNTGSVSKNALPYDVPWERWIEDKTPKPSGRVLSGW